MMKKSLIKLAVLVAAAPTGVAQSQTPPDAGQTLQQMMPPPAAPAESKPFRFEMPAAPAPVLAGGEQVQVDSVELTGNTVFSTDVLKAQIADALGKPHDLAGMREMADRMSAYYRGRGYPFARVFVPAQEFKDGVLRLRVVEGNFGKVEAIGEPRLASGGQRFLGGLKSGDVIDSARLERAMLILEGLPGIKITPTIRPGGEVGSGDLAVLVERESRYGGDVGIDNTGSRFTGDLRAHATVYADSPFLFGDRVSLTALYTNEDLWLGSLDYQIPVGGSGLSAQFGYSHTSYTLGKDFADLDSTGLARVLSARLDYPIVRSQQRNFYVSAGVQRKNLQDKFGKLDTVDNKWSQVWPVSLRFDNRDGFGDGGLTYGTVTWTGGNLHLGDNGAADNANKEGVFHKWNLELARVQRLPAHLSLFGRYSRQWTSKNLDSSERFSLGGASGVRAYPMGEGFGDLGWLVQTELRYEAAIVSPYLLFDAGKIETNAKPWDDNTAGHRFLSGAGVGLRANYLGWNMDLTVAWRINGGTPTSDSRNNNPNIWLTAGYRF